MEPGQILRHYEILEELGRGGMGVVYKARDTKLDRIVALKFLPGYMSYEEDAVQRFVREARAASALDHANICTIHEIAETDDGELYIVMAYYEGKPLDELLKDQTLSVETITDISKQLAQALERAHEAGIVHRDLKPANIMITNRGEVKLLDFGLAKLTSGTELTQTGTQLGTVSYMSPEQVDAKTLDHRTDLWSFGIVLHEMLTGQTPFKGESAQAMMFSIITKEPDSVRDQRPDVSDDLVRIVARCLRKNPDERPSSAAALWNDLTDTMHVPSGVALAPKDRKTKKPPLVVALGAAAMVAIFTVGTLVTRGSADANATLSDDLVAVVPFTVRGSPDLMYLGEGIVDLMSAKLTGVGTLAAVNPRNVISLVTSQKVDVSDPAANRRIAEQAQAGQYVTGDLLEVGGRVTLTAYLHNTRDAGEQPAQATAEGTAEDLFNLVDKVVADLLAQSMPGGTDRLQTLASATTSSLPALKAYLEGEQLLRGGQYRSAADAYNRAVDLDSTFALAYYRKSIAADWIDAVDSRTSAEKAFALSDNLPPRDRAVLAALTLRRTGRNNEAEQAYTAHLHQYPDDVEALVQLGEVQFHDNPRRGRLLTEAMEPFRKAIDVEPNNLIAQIHVARTYALMDSIDALRRVAAYLAEVAPESERALEVEAIYAFAAGDTLQQERVRNTLDERPWIFRFYAAHGVDRFSRATHEAAGLLARRPGEEPLLATIAANLMIVLGKHDEFRRTMNSHRQSGSATWDLYDATILTSGAYAATEAEMLDALDRVQRATAQEILSTSITPPYEDITPRYAIFERDYLTARLLIQLDRIAEARSLIDALAAEDEFVGLGSMQRDVILGLNAEIHYQSGEHERALALLRQIEYEVPHAAGYRVVADGARSRILRAELEQEIGDPVAARNYYNGIDTSWSPWDSPYRNRAYMGLGKMAEDEGRLDEAVKQYTRLLELWRDADPEFADEVNALRDRRDALQSGN